jgi:energy-coupling factor transport system permease protein
VAVPEPRVTSFTFPRALHPAAWWLWALCLATVAARTTNPVLLLLVATVAGFVVAARRSRAPWARSYGAFLRLGLVVLAIRIVIEVVFGATGTGSVVVRLPEAPLPHWMAGVTIGGPLTTDELVRATYEGLQLAVLLGCIGAANALASPARVLKLLPGALYEAGVAATVALSFAPQAVGSVARIKAARQLRGHPAHGLRAWRGLAVPVLEDALERSVALAAAMDARGFGRRGDEPPASRRLTVALTLGGLLAIAAGSYGLLATGAPRALGLPLVLGGAAVAAIGLAVGGRRSVRTRYRPDPWQAPEWLVAATGLVAVLGVVLAGHHDPLSVSPSVTPLAVPSLPPLAAIGVLIALLPAWGTPRPIAGAAR